MVLVTGGTGFIGTHLLARLSASGCPVRCLVRRKAQPRALPDGVPAFYGDLASGEGLQDALRGADTVIHLAGVTKALKPEDYYTGNVRATEQLAQALAGHAVRLVHVSSLAAIGPSQNGAPVGEDDAPHPLTHYGRSKLEGERRVRQMLPDAVIVRPPAVYGPRDTDVFQLLKSISKGLELQFAGGERWFSAIYVKDLVDGLLAAARAPGAPGRAYFLAHAKAASWTDFGAAAARGMSRTAARTLRVPVSIASAAGGCAELWARLTNKPGSISRDKVAEMACMNWTCDTGRATRELGFTAPTSLETGLAETLAWYKEAGWLNY